MTDPQSQRELISKALSREPAAVRALIDQLSPVIERGVAAALWRRAPGRDIRTEVQDMTQDVFLSLFAGDGKALRAWDPERGMSLASFVGLLARHQVSSILRTGRTQPFRDEPTEAATLEALPDVGPAPDAVVGSREQVARLLERVRARLSPRGIELFQRLVVDEESLESLSETTGLSRDALYQWRSRFAKLVRQVSAEESATFLSESAPGPRTSKSGSRG
jgi:DNA-directed RNA polymerase specialized sigma24 family protein